MRSRFKRRSSSTSAAVRPRPISRRAPHPSRESYSAYSGIECKPFALVRLAGHITSLTLWFSCPSFKNLDSGDFAGSQRGFIEGVTKGTTKLCRAGATGGRRFCDWWLPVLRLVVGDFATGAIRAGATGSSPAHCLVPWDSTQTSWLITRYSLASYMPVALLRFLPLPLIGMSHPFSTRDAVARYITSFETPENRAAILRPSNSSAFFPPLVSLMQTSNRPLSARVRC